MNDFMGDVGCSSHVVYYNAETVCDVFPFDTELIVMIFSLTSSFILFILSNLKDFCDLVYIFYS